MTARFVRDEHSCPCTREKEPMQIEEVFTPQQIIKVQELADEIWREYYPAIISQDQIGYMLSTFQTAKAILKQINEGYTYFLLLEKDKEIGYMAIENRQKSLFISKLYINKASRKKGYARKAVSFLQDQAKAHKLSSLSLTVNIHNKTAIQAYEHLGFKNKGSLIQDIGEGFIMDDFVFELQC